MDVERPQEPPEPELAGFRPGPLGTWMGDEPEAYLRLVVNPFLALLYLVAWLMALYYSVVSWFAGALTVTFIVTLIFGLWLTPYFIHYHCLDCGETGRLLRWKKHVCHRALARRESGRRRMLRGPSPPIQVVLWFWFLLALAMLLNAVEPRWFAT